MTDIRVPKLELGNENYYQVWQEGFHPQDITSEEMLYQKTVYLHENPVRIGVVEEPEHWVYSSARDYAGGKGMMELDDFD